jgi:hypothetical protein
MPVARFEMPDGRIARFEVPEGTTPEQAQAMIQESMAQQTTAPQSQAVEAAPVQQPEGINAGDLSRAGLQGLTFGFADEAGAALAAAVGKAAQSVGALPGDQQYMDIYRDMKGQLQADQNKFQAEHPFASFGAELAGGIATGLPAKAISAGKSIFGLAKEGAKQGAKFGALYGAGTAETGETLGESAVNTAQGTATGGAIGGLAGGIATPLIGGVGRAIGTGVKRIKDVMNSKQITGSMGGDDIANAVTDEEAAIMVGEIAERAGLSADDIAKKLETLGSKGTLADVDENFAFQLHDAISRFSPAKGAVRKQYAERIIGEHSDVLKSLSKQFDNYSADDVYAALDKSAKERKKIAGPLYDKAFSMQFPENLASNKIFRIENVQKALKAGENLAKNDPDRLMEIDGVMKARPLGPVEKLHYAKKSLWDQAQTLKRAGSLEEARFIDAQRKEVDKVLNSIPEYEQARKIWSSSLEVDAAADIGRDILNMPAREFSDAVKRMNPHELEMAKMGALSSASDKIEKTGDKRSVARILIKDEATRKKMQVLFGGTDEIDSLMKSADKWDTFRKTNSILSQQSKTREFTQASQEIDAITSAITQKASKQVLDLLKGERLTADRANMVAKILSKEGITKDEVQRLINLNRKMFTPKLSSDLAIKSTTIPATKELQEL